MMVSLMSFRLVKVFFLLFFLFENVSCNNCLAIVIPLSGQVLSCEREGGWMNWIYKIHLKYKKKKN